MRDGWAYIVRFRYCDGRSIPWGTKRLRRCGREDRSRGGKKSQRKKVFGRFSKTIVSPAAKYLLIHPYALCVMSLAASNRMPCSEVSTPIDNRGERLQGSVSLCTVRKRRSP